MSGRLEEMKEREAKEAGPDADYLMKYYDPDRVLEENEGDRRYQGKNVTSS